MVEVILSKEIKTQNVPRDYWRKRYVSGVHELEFGFRKVPSKLALVDTQLFTNESDGVGVLQN